MRDLAYELRERLGAGDVEAWARCCARTGSSSARWSTGISDDADRRAGTSARSQAGATGGKLLGAGAGGFLLLVAPAERHAAVRGALSRPARGARCASPRGEPRSSLLEPGRDIETGDEQHRRRTSSASARRSTRCRGTRLAQLGEMLFRAYRNDKQVFTLGNGGSASTASHMAADLAKNTIGPNMRRFRILSLNDNAAIMTALANDLGYENVFSRAAREPRSRPGDVLIVDLGQRQLAERAQGDPVRAGHGAPRWSRCSASTAATRRRSRDLAIVVPSDHYGIVEDVHLIINHILVDYFKAKLADEAPWVV